MASSTPPDKTTIFDEEIARLEKRRAEVEIERQQLLAGQITVIGPDGSSLMKIDLGVLSATANDQKTIERNLRQTLIENPFVPVLDSSFKKTRELRDELIGRGELQSLYITGTNSPINRLVWANSHSNQLVRSKSQPLGKVFASPWLLAIGALILIIWCGGPILYTISGGSIGGKPVGTTIPVKPTITPSKSQPATPSPHNATQTEADQISGTNLSKVEKIGYLEQPLKVQGFNEIQQVTTTPDSPTPQVGNQPTNAAGLNGPHGSFLAPSRMVVSALGLDTKVERALTQDSNNGRVSIVTWPRPGEVVHTGTFPGEIGNMLFMGNQEDLGALRRIQQNDEITVYDRKGNVFIYRMLPFSADGQTERVIDPTSLEDAWIFNPTDTAILTILVTYPQPLPPVDPNQSGNHNQVIPRDDYLVQKKLAYRAVLTMYAPAKVTPSGRAVDVPASVWQTVPASYSTDTPTVAAQGTTPPPGAITPSVTSSGSGPYTSDTPAQSTLTVLIPSGVPATGEGGGAVLCSQCIHNRYSDK